EFYDKNGNLRIQTSWGEKLCSRRFAHIGWKLCTARKIDVSNKKCFLACSLAPHHFELERRLQWWFRNPADERPRSGSPSNSRWHGYDSAARFPRVSHRARFGDRIQDGEREEPS